MQQKLSFLGDQNRKLMLTGRLDQHGRLQQTAAESRPRVLAAERIPNTDKLLKTVDRGEQRQIVACIALHYQPEDLVGKTIIIVNNLQPAVLGGVESQGMLLAAKRKKELRILTVDGEIPWRQRG